MASPRSIASQGERGRSSTAMSAGSTAAPGEEEIQQEPEPAGETGGDLEVKRHLGERRPERFDEGGEEEHERRAVHETHRRPRRRDEGGLSRHVARGDDREPEAK